MVGNIVDYAEKNSIYSKLSTLPFISKEHLQEWETTHVQSFQSATNGTSTGKRFTYPIWEDVYDKIEGELHYAMILREFELGDDITVVDFRLEQGGNKLVSHQKNNSIISCHGAPNATVYAFNRPLGFNDNAEYFNAALTAILDIKPDVILSSGHIIHLLVNSIRRNNITTKICKLLSNTCEMLHHADVEYLMSQNIIDNWCDHMRCWDGGMMFFTCRYNTYHLCDHLSYVYPTGGIREDRLVSTDYFSFAAPFINYWNGDRGFVSDRYDRCRCGRLYRMFKLYKPRSFMVGNATSGQIIDKIHNTGIKGIHMVNTYGMHLIVHAYRELRAEEQAILKEALPNIIEFRITE